MPSRGPSSRNVLLSPFRVLLVVFVTLSLIHVCFAQYYSSSGDYGSSGGSDSSSPFDSSSDSPFSSSTDFSSSGGGSSGSSGGSSGSSGGSSGSSGGSSGSSGSSGSGGSSTGSAATSTPHTSSPKSTTSSAKAATSAPKQPTSAPKAPTSAPLRASSSSTGGIGCATATTASLSLSANGFSFIQNGEGFGPFYYYDTATTPQATIGFGHDCAANLDCTSSVYTKGYVTLAEAVTILQNDVNTATAAVRKVISSTAQLTQNQFNVLVDMGINFGHVPQNMVTFISGYNGAAIPLQAFSTAVKGTTGSNPTRVSQEASYSLSCGTPTFGYKQGDGQYCASGNHTGLCLDNRIYSCPTGAFVSGTTGCASDGATVQCCAIPTPAGQTANTVQLTLALSSHPTGVPTSFTGTVNPATFNTNGARR